MQGVKYSKRISSKVTSGEALVVGFKGQFPQELFIKSF